MNKLLLLVGAAVAAVAGGAQTFAEFKAAVESAEAGSTVYLENDVECDAMITLDRNLTITSRGDRPFTVRRAASMVDSPVLWVPSRADEVRTVTLSNITLDGNSAAGETCYPLIDTDGNNSATNKVIVFENGFSLVNVDLNDTSGNKRYGAVRIRPGTLIMRTGSVISNCVSHAYGAAVYVVAHGMLRMEGGRITGCRDVNPEVSALNGGAVYVHGESKFVFTGGEITGNVSEHGFGGVIVNNSMLEQRIVSSGSGVLYLCGGGLIRDNFGGFADDRRQTNVYCPKADSVWLTTDTALQGSAYSNASIGLTTYNSDIEGAGDRVGGFTLQRSNSKVANTSNIFMDRDPSLVFDPDSYAKDDGSAGYVPKWAKRGARYAVEGDNVGQMVLSFEEAWTALTTAGTIEVFRDVERSNAAGQMNNSLFSITIRGVKDGAASPDDRVTFKLADDWSEKALFAVTKTASLAFEDVILDGNRDNGARVKPGQGMVYCAGSGRVTLKKGAEIRNVKIDSNGGPAIYAKESAVVRMESGSMITNCAGSWCSAVAVVGAKFEFAGGTITGCDSFSTSAVTGGNGGAVYASGGRIEMSGDALVTGNLASHTVSGVQLYGANSEMCVSGRARVCGNSGTYGGVFLHSYKSGCLTYKGDFRGRIALCGGVSGGSVWKPAVGTDMVFRPEEGATGVWCFESHSGDLAVGADYKFAASVGTVGANRFATLDLINQRLLLAEDLDAEGFSAITLTGEALGATIIQRLVFDAKAMKLMLSKLDPPSLMLYDFGDEKFTGTATFTFPDDQDKRWEVVADNGGLWLKYLKPGLIVTIR